MNYITLKEMMANTKLHFISEKIFILLWKKFSDIQHATFLILNNENKERFLEWIVSGNDDDAWS